MEEPVVPTPFDYDPEATTLLPIFRPNELDSVPVCSQANDICDLIIAHVEHSLKSEQLRSPQTNSFLIRPLMDAIRKHYASPALMYALLANKIHFAIESKNDPAFAQLWLTRSAVCEIVAVRMIPNFLMDDLAQNIVFGFYPLADGTVDKATVIPYWLRMSALELAIHGEAKTFLAHPAIASIVEELWKGTLVFDAVLYKAHRLKLRDRQQLNTMLSGRRGLLGRYNHEDVSFFKLSRLRVPMYRHVLKLFSVTVLVVLYFANLGNRASEITLSEVLFTIWALGFALDELTNLRYIGWSLYFQSLWSACDFCTMIALGCYWLFRGMALFGSESTAATLNNWAYNVLATAAIFLIPRIFCVLETNKGFSRIAISMRKMSIDLTYCCIAVIVFSIGFWASLVSFAEGIYTPKAIFYDQVRILFGFTPAVWESWRNYSLLGRSVLFFYLFLAQFVVSTMVIAALAARYRDIVDNAEEEHHFQRAVRVESKIKSEQATLFFYAEPFNLLNWMTYPLIYVIPIRSYLHMNRLMLKATHIPIFACIYVCERITAQLESRKRDKAEDQSERIKRHFQDRNAARARQRSRKPRRRFPQSRAFPDVEPAVAPNITTLGLVEEVLSNPSNSIPRNVSKPAHRPSFDVLAEEAHPARRRGLSFSSVAASQRLHSGYALSPSRSSGAAFRSFGERRRPSMDSEQEPDPEADILYDDRTDLLDYLEEIERSNLRIESMLEKVCSRMNS